MNKKICVLYLASGGHLYGDNRSLLQLVIQNKFLIDEYVCTTSEGPFTEILNANNIPYFIVDSVLGFNFSQKRSTFRKWFGRIRRSPLAYLKLSNIINNIKPDIIHSNNSLIFSGYVMSKVYKIPHVWHIREYQTLDHNLKNRHLSLEKNWMRKSYCIGISKGIYDFWNLQSTKDIQLYNGIYSKTDMMPYIYNKDNFFLYTGRITQTKGVHELIEAFGLFCRMNNTYRLILAGDGDEDYMKRLHGILKRYNICNRVVFKGFVDDVRPLMRKAKALIVPSYFEALGRITIEAMLMGCFVIGRNTGGTKEILEKEKAGILFNNISDLVTSMQKVSNMTDKDLFICNKKVYDSAISHYSAEVNASETYKFYLRILKKQI